jgi:hypothetical protein
VVYRAHVKPATPTVRPLRAAGASEAGEIPATAAEGAARLLPPYTEAFIVSFQTPWDLIRRAAGLKVEKPTDFSLPEEPPLRLRKLARRGRAYKVKARRGETPGEGRKRNSNLDQWPSLPRNARRCYPSPGGDLLPPSDGTRASSFWSFQLARFTGIETPRRGEDGPHAPPDQASLAQPSRKDLPTLRRKDLLSSTMDLFPQNIPLTLEALEVYWR